MIENHRAAAVRARVETTPDGKITVSDKPEVRKLSNLQAAVFYNDGTSKAVDINLDIFNSLIKESLQEKSKTQLVAIYSELLPLAISYFWKKERTLHLPKEVGVFQLTLGEIVYVFFNADSSELLDEMLEKQTIPALKNARGTFT